jgi:UDP-N-acetylmuramoyl-L-alanyl-D-glutamate--2,6-diaminopimelate ligase
VTLKPLRAAGVSLRKALADELTARPRDLRATSCTSDFRQVRQGDVFVALAGAESDGHDFAVEAARRGAAAVVCERMLPVFDVPQFVVRNSRVAYGKLCQALVGNPSEQLKVIGVTGTSGKTTVVRLLASILNIAGFEAGAIDSLMHWDGQDCRPTACQSNADAELSPPVLARWLGQMAANGLTHAIVEVSSRDLVQSALAGVELDAACVTHVGRDHLDWHGSLDNYRRAKRQILDHLHADGVAILNADCQPSMRMLAELDGPALTIGLRQRAEITAEIVEQHINEQTFVLTAGDDSVGVRTAIVGDHHVYNCLTAAALCLSYGVELTTIARGLEAVDELPGRMQRVVCGQDFAVLVDVANTPDTLRACLKAARNVTSGRLICIFGANGEMQRDQLPALGRVAGSLADVSVVTTTGPRERGSRDFTRQIVAGFTDPKTVHVILDRAEAIAWGLDQASEGDTVVLAGMGDRLYPSGNTNELPWDDGDVARRVLTGVFGSAPAHRVAA